MKPHDPDNGCAPEESTDPTEEITMLDLRSLKVRAYLENLTRRSTRIERRNNLHIVHGTLPGRTIEVQVTPTSYAVLGMRGTFAVRFKAYLALHLAADCGLGY